MASIRISWPKGKITATLRDTPTVKLLVDALPMTGSASVWGDEVYFRVPFSAKGAVCFWLDGDSLALLFGPTPVSRGDECRLISPANILGQIDGDPAVLASVNPGDAIEVEPT